MRTGPYVGVAGITSREEAIAVVKSAPALEGFRVALGVLTSKKVLDGGERNRRSPAAHDIANIWPGDADALCLLHYFTRDMTDLKGQLLRAMELGGPRCDGIQLNIEWPALSAVAAIRARHPAARIVFQLGPHALESVQWSGTYAAVRLHPYLSYITDVLIDMSDGTGASIDIPKIAEFMAPLVRLRERMPIGFGVAGGLGSLPSIRALAPLLDYFGPLSTDAESAVRDHRDHLDLLKVTAYREAVGREQATASTQRAQEARSRSISTGFVR